MSRPALTPLIMPNSPAELAKARPLWWLGMVLQLMLVAVAILLARAPDDSRLAGLLLPLILLSFVPYLLGIRRALKLPPALGLRGIILFAVVCRLTLLFAPPALSTGAYRYLWEGRAQTLGVNPYVEPPRSPRLGALAPELLTRVELQSVPADAPALSQLLFRAAAIVWPHGPGFLRFLFALLDVGVVWLLARLLRLRGLNENAALIYAWNPLPILEFAGNGHYLPLAMFLALVAVYLAEPPPRQRWAGTVEQALAALSVGGAVISHGFALLLVPLVARQIKLRFWPLAPLVMALFYLPFIGAGPRVWDGLLYHVGRARFNDSLFTLLAWVTGESWTLNLGADMVVQWLLAKAIVAGLLAGGLVVMMVLRVETLRAFYLVSGALLLFSPVVSPWHVAWMLPFLCFWRNTGWLLLSAGVMLSYVARIVQFETGVAMDFMPLKWAGYAPAMVLMIWSAVSPYVVPAVRHEAARKRM